MADAPKYKSVSQLHTADALADKRRELEDLRVTDVREWSLNRAFYKGDQWVFWNRVSNEVETLPVAEGDKPRWKVRLTSNQILPGVQHYAAQLTKNKPVITATPDSSAYRDVCAAQVGSSLFDYWWEDFHLKSKLQSALILSCLSQGYWKITWDPFAGKSMRITVGPDGQPILNEDMADAFREQITEMAKAEGQDPKPILEQFEQTIYVGDIKVEVLPGENVLIDPAATRYEDANYVICKHAMDVDDIYARYKKRVEPNSSPALTHIPLAYSKERANTTPKTVRDVYIGYFRPTPVMPKGRYVVWIEEPNEILLDEPWQFPFNELPIVKFPGLERPDSATDEPLVTHVRPLQKELNRTLSQMVQFKDLTIKPQMLAPIGSLRQRLTDEPGAVFEYQPIQGLAPEWRNSPNLPQSTMNILADIQQRIDKLFNRLPSQRDQLPARSDSGYQLELIQEAVADQIAPVIGRIEEALARAGKLMVLLAKNYYIEPRLLKIRGEGGAIQVKKFMNSDLEGGFSFHAESGSGLPRSRAGRQQQILDLVEKQILNPRTALKYLDIADMRGLRAHFEADEDQAYREHDKMVKGEPINMMAVQEAVQAVQMAIQQDPMAIPEGMIHQVLQEAALQPLVYENKATHLEIHGLYMKSPEFQQLPPEAQQQFMTHYRLTSEAVKGETPPDPKSLPKISINARSTTSAPVMGEALRRAGINVSDEQVTEPPLETAVYDSVDKPDMDSAGNDPLEDEERLMAMEMQSAEHAQKMSRAAADMTLAQRRAKMDEERVKNQERRADEQHRARVKQMNRPNPGGSGGK